MADTLYCGLTLEWNYINQFVDISMPWYIQKVLHRFNHPLSHRSQHAPHKWERPIYGSPVEYNTINPELALLPPNEITRIQQIIGAIL